LVGLVKEYLESTTDSDGVRRVMAEENVNAIKQKVVEKHKLQFKKPKAQIITIETNSSPMREFGAKKVPNSSLDFQDEA